MSRRDQTGVTTEEFQVAVYALCDGLKMCDDRRGCRCIDAQVAASEMVWLAFTAVQHHRKNS